MYWQLQASVESMKSSIELASQVLPEGDLLLIGSNMKALQTQLEQIEAYSDALQVNSLFNTLHELIQLSQIL